MLYGLLAHPAGHSKSPKMQNAMMQASDLPAHYEAFDVDPNQLAVAIAGLKALGAGGFNVSTPFKAAVIPYLDQVSPLAQRLQAVNTVKIEAGRLIGTSTDGDGFWKSLPQGQVKQRVVILGTGGAARAVIASAKEYGVTSLTVFNRRHTDWLQRQEALAKLNPQAQLMDIVDEKLLQEALSQADLLINATTVGMDGDDCLLTTTMLNYLPASAYVVDMIYRNARTKLLQLAQARGLKTQNGLPMLVGQGALSFEYWFNRPADRKLMKKEIEE
ncbi:shikimate dehydrogenase [Convivina intestini]|uniref:Shikimate dehydrogenase (NADP(+)) n=1 Tax=Convivina intestini TaxID=1505726 RepID=A0A2U1DER3_9LACO|nr:shikimate dehydrogenase [Convivina intestini]PVY86170.1 shikimate dehydrogenase [Convivina intestini]CAH1851401.1 Shikimate dehydrogenase (NADP(+)) [Convivina intestini]CAH1852889.1 Shikimate dehydrogenase (NADP(+)) [Convivina intestini]SDB81221.1 shikimate dehydrogenase [Leuconostocaceae bacterium R-53105]